MSIGSIAVTAIIAFTAGIAATVWFIRCDMVHGYCRRVCPRDGTPMRKAGNIKQGPRKGRRDVYICPKCNHKTM